jgi:hypothetical protein
MLLLLLLFLTGCTAYAFCKDPNGCGTGCSTYVSKNPAGTEWGWEGERDE